MIYKITSLERDEPLKAGFSVPKKIIKKAVKRNYMKRLMREAYRKEKADIRRDLVHINKQADILFVFTAKDMLPYMQIKEEILVSLGQFSNTLKKYI